MKFHINPTTGKVGQCKAKNGSCPHGGEQEHFATREQANNHATNKNHQEFSTSLYKSSSKNTVHNGGNEHIESIVPRPPVNNVPIDNNEHPENTSAHPEDVVYSERLIFNAWIGNRRGELNRHLMDNSNAKVMDTVKTFTENDIKEAVKLNYLPSDLNYKVNIVEDGGFGERVISVEAIDNDKTNFENKEFKIVPMRDGSYSIIPQSKQESINIKNRLEDIVENYNFKIKNLDGYHENDFFIHSSVEGGKVPNSLDDNFQKGNQLLNDYYRGNASEDDLRVQVDNFYAHDYENRVYEQVKVANDTLKGIRSMDSNDILNRENAEIFSESLHESERSLNLKYRTSVEVTMDYLKSNKAPNKAQEHFIDKKIRNAKSVSRLNKK